MHNLKAPWVDECYTYYGIWHDNFSEFYDSMLTGINFSPPLYFLFNFCIQLAFPTSIENLRIQSLIWTILGIILSFLTARKVIGQLPAFLSIALVFSQSKLILLQSQEARHYTMLFMIGAWVLYMSTFRNNSSKAFLIHTFISHFCLCQVHYFGIIFSGLVGLAYLIKDRSIFLRECPISIILSWIISVPIYIFLLSNQSSHLGDWPKPNKFENLLELYNDCFLFLSFLFPLITYLIFQKPKKPTSAHSKKLNYQKNVTVLTSIFWILTPFVFWMLSHITSLNLFVDRYFIIKEIALVILSAWFLKFILFKISPKVSATTVKFTTSLACLIFISFNFKRSAFGLNKTRNYHHSLIINLKESKDDDSIILNYDHTFFPNMYIYPNKYHFEIKNKDLKVIYKDFSKKINLIE